MCALNQLCAPRHDGRDGKNNEQGRSGCTSFPDLQFFLTLFKRGGAGGHTHVKKISSWKMSDSPEAQKAKTFQVGTKPFYET